MRALLAGLLAMAVAVSACGPREVEVGSTPAAQSDLAVRVTNNLSQPVNVYVVNVGQEVFLGQVSANGSEALDVVGMAPGTIVSLRARTADGTRTYSRDNVTLTGTYRWQVP